MIFVEYKHHGNSVWVNEQLRGRHSEHCLCHSCKHFSPNAEDNCTIAQELYEFDVKHKMVTPVWECPQFEIRSLK